MVDPEVVECPPVAVAEDVPAPVAEALAELESRIEALEPQ